MGKWAALVLAGGEASRFQMEGQPWIDKALVAADGKPLLARVVLGLREVLDDVVVCVNNTERKDRYRQALMEHGVENVKFVIDQDSPVQGPLLAVTSGLHSVYADYCLTVPTDMPYLKPEIARYLFSAAEGYDVSVPLWPNGTLETLLMTLKREVAMEVAGTVLLAGRANADAIARACGKLLLLSPLGKIVELDPQLKSFININSALDLNEPKTRSTQGETRENLIFDRNELDISMLKKFRQGLKRLSECKAGEARKIFSEYTEFSEGEGHLFWAGLSAEKLAQTTVNCREAFLRAAKNYHAEAQQYREKGCLVLACRADADAAWCQKQVD